MINIRRLGRWFGSGHRENAATHISLGTFCHAAAALRDCGLRGWSGPFDWIFTDPAMVADCIENDFATLLDPQHLVSVPAVELTSGAKRQSRHPAYEARYNLPTLFNHHDPAASGSDRRTLERAVDRFRTVLNSGAALHFYLLSQREWPQDDLARLLRVLQTRADDVRLVVATIEPAGRQAGWTRADKADGIVDLRIRTRTRSLGTKFPDVADDALLAEALLGYAGDPRGSRAGP